MPSFFEFATEQFKSLPLAFTRDDCAGKTYIVTGANSGLGYECAKHLVQAKASRVIMAVRNVPAGETAQAEIESATGVAAGSVLQVWKLDLGSFDSVKAFAKKVEAELDRVDGVVENAGVALERWETGEDDIEMTMTVNLLSTLLLAILLVPHLDKAAQRHKIKPRIALIGSEVAFTGEAKACLDKLDRDDVLGDLKNQAKWGGSSSAMYPFSKLLLFFTYRQLAALLSSSSKHVTITYVNPGLCRTGLSRNSTGLASLAVEVPKYFLGRTAEAGSRTLLHGVAAEDGHGKYLSACAVKEQHVPGWVTDETGQIWAHSTWTQVSSFLEKTAPGCLAGLE